MRTLVAAVTLPLWLPVLCAAGCASLVLGMTLVVMTSAARQRFTPDPWDAPEYKDVA